MLRRGPTVRPCGPMEQDQDYVTPLALAVEEGAAKCAAELLKHGAKVDSLDQDAQTALHRASRSYVPPSKVVAAVKELIRAGAKVNAKDASGAHAARSCDQDRLALPTSRILRLVDCSSRHGAKLEL